jgi:hypothetical protein
VRYNSMARWLIGRIREGLGWRLGAVGRGEIVQENRREDEGDRYVGCSLQVETAVSEVREG